MDQLAMPVAGEDLQALVASGHAREDHGVTVSGGHTQWARHEITALIPEDADLRRFGITLGGPGQVALRDPELRIPSGIRSGYSLASGVLARRRGAGRLRERRRS
jgi:hypothetical protein